jgi:hypothetical protein
MLEKIEDIYDVVYPLMGLDSCINNMIENFNLDSAAMTSEQKEDLVNRYDMIYDVMFHVKTMIQDTLTKAGILPD